MAALPKILAAAQVKIGSKMEAENLDEIIALLKGSPILNDAPGPQTIHWKTLASGAGNRVRTDDLLITNFVSLGVRSGAPMCRYAPLVGT